MRDGKIVGIVSRADLLKVLASGGTEAAHEEQDRTIRTQLLAELREQKWADASEGRVVVSDGIVHLWGIVGSENERRALRIAAENTPGVRASRITRNLRPLYRRCEAPRDPSRPAQR